MAFDPNYVVGGVFLFTIVAVGMLLAPLLIGKFLRPSAPGEEKAAVYECGEPTIGSSYTQFDLRFYVVALLFIIFDVEIAFFFPWAVVFGKANALSDPNRITAEQRVTISESLLGQPLPEGSEGIMPETAAAFLQIALADLLVFFGVVLVGFAYVWKRGDLDWVRAVAVERAREWQETRPSAPDKVLVS